MFDNFESWTIKPNYDFEKIMNEIKLHEINHNYLLNIEKKSFHLIEKFVFEISHFHITKLNLNESDICIEYFFENNAHKYKVDFELPTDKLLLEIKDNHIWHKNQVASGKFSKKEECAKKWCVEHNYKYILAFPKTMSKLKELLLKKTPILEDIV